MTQPTVSVRQFVEDAYQLISASTPTVPLQGNDLNKGIQILNYLIKQYSASGLLITVSKELDFPLTTNEGVVSFAEADYVPAPVVIPQGPLITDYGRLANLGNAWVNLNNVDYPLIIISRTLFMSSYKYAPLAGLPRYAIVYPQTNITSVQVFPKPSQDYNLRIYGKFEIAAFTANDDMSSLPTYSQLYVLYALARQLSKFKGRNQAWTQDLEAMYSELYADMIANSSNNLDLSINNESWLNGAWRVRAGI